MSSVTSDKTAAETVFGGSIAHKGIKSIATAIKIVKNSGAESLNARNIASALNCSTQPIFSNFATMEELQSEVMKKAADICNDYIKREVESNIYPVYKASGMAYIRFAKEEKELFKLLYMRSRSGDNESCGTELFDEMKNLVHNNTGLNDNDSELFHLEMWIYVHGIAVMFATDFLDLDWELVSRMLTDAYNGLRKQYEAE